MEKKVQLSPRALSALLVGSVVTSVISVGAVMFMNTASYRLTDTRNAFAVEALRGKTVEVALRATSDSQHAAILTAEGFQSAGEVNARIHVLAYDAEIFAKRLDQIEALKPFVLAIAWMSFAMLVFSVLRVTSILRRLRVKDQAAAAAQLSEQ